jgi:hypothetical protein
VTAVTLEKLIKAMHSRNARGAANRLNSSGRLFCFQNFATPCGIAEPATVGLSSGLRTNKHRVPFHRDGQKGE